MTPERLKTRHRAVEPNRLLVTKIMSKLELGRLIQVDHIFRRHFALEECQGLIHVLVPLLRQRQHVAPGLGSENLAQHDDTGRECQGEADSLFCNPYE